MKKVLLKIGFVLCLLLTALFAKVARHFFLRDIGTFLFSVFIATGPTLGMIAFWNELNEKRSWKILLCLGIWIVGITLFFLCVLNSVPI